ncbi:MAG: hypothetical protein GY777_23070 [Candidatus Brocadiaceae bacterium]|nr:hypothetical protein [Candidatus Brocadiaceae bacterium]
MKTFTVTVEKDHISKLTHVSPQNAIAELIWNSVDAEATEISLSFERTELAVQKLIVQDNGHGISANDAQTLFGTLGGSWKRGKKQTDNRHRLLHGREGQGRFRAFAVGALVTWNSVYEQNEQKYQFSITGSLEEINKFSVSDVIEVPSETQTGVTVIIENIVRQSSFFNADTARERLTSLFALYLKSYSSTKIIVDGTAINPDDLILRHGNRKLKKVSYDGVDFPSSLEIVEWNLDCGQEIYFCSEAGFPLARCENHSFLLESSRSYTVYIKSEMFEKLNSCGLLHIAGMIPELEEIVLATVKKLNSYFKSKEKKEQSKEVLNWQDEKSYPYSGEPKTLWEKSERRIFDTVAHEVVKHLPELQSASPKLRSFQFSLFKEMIEKSPDTLTAVFSELFKMKKSESESLESQVSRFIRQKENGQ